MAMKMNRMLIVAVASLGAAGWGMAAHADAKAKFAADCAECHEAGDFEGEDAAALAATMKKMAAGQMKHKTAIKLSEAELTEIAAYMAKGGK
jgi:nitrate/TMAO reductase-like tetraheme cytochrome c subunit